MMKTIYHESIKSALTSSRLDILCYLLAHQDEPVYIDEIADATGLSQAKIEQELGVLEGPLGGNAEKGNASYIHKARCSNQVVFIG